MSLRVAALLSSLFAVLARGQPGRRLHQAALDAKARSLTQISIPPPAILPTGVDDMDTVAAHYSVLVARPVQTVVSTVESESIETWYKFQIEEIVLRQRKVSTDPIAGLKIPAALLPLASNQSLLTLPGGSVTIDGVTIKEGRSAGLNLNFVPGNRYLLCVLLEAGGTVASLAAMSDGAFLLQPGGTLKPLGPIDRPLVRDVETRFSNRLDLFRPYLERHAPRAPQ